MFIARIMDLVSRVDDATAIDRQKAPGIMFADPRKKSIGIGVVDDCSMEHWPLVRKQVKSLLPSLRAARAFDFGLVQMSQRGDDYALPRLDAEAVDTFNGGVIRLPFATCWFEYDLPPDRRIGLLVEDKGDRIEVRQFSMDLCLKKPVYDLPSHAILCRQPGRHHEGAGGWMTSDEGLFYAVSDPLEAVTRASARGIPAKDLDEGGVVRDTAEDGLFFAYLAMVLQSREKSVEVVRQNAFSNRRRTGRGCHADPDFHRITMSPGWAPGPAGSFADPADDDEGETPHS